MPLIVNRRLFIYLFFGFIFTLVIGIVSHEWGHWITSRYLGFKTSRLCYAYTSYCGFNEKFRRYMVIFKQYTDEIHYNQDFPLKQEFETLTRQTSKEWSMIETGGLLLTLLTGTTGFLLIIRIRKKFIEAIQLTVGQWLLVFLSLFWFREIALLIAAVISLSAGNLHYIACDFKLARTLHWPTWSIVIVTGLTGLIISCMVVFRFIPARQRFTFIMAGLTGGLTGAYLWLVLIGPKIMP